MSFLDYDGDVSSSQYFDSSNPDPEKVYHSFILGLLASLEETHEVRSNRESGLGRYDIIIIPKDPKKLGTVIEFKVLGAKDTNESAIMQSIAQAFAQIDEKRYATELVARGVQQIQLIVIAFKGKDIVVQVKTK